MKGTGQKAIKQTKEVLVFAEIPQQNQKSFKITSSALESFVSDRLYPTHVWEQSPFYDFDRLDRLTKWFKELSIIGIYKLFVCSFH